MGPAQNTGLGVTLDAPAPMATEPGTAKRLPSTASDTGPVDSSVYRMTARAMVPRWTRLLSPLGSLGDADGFAGNRSESVSQQYRRQRAALATALVCEFDEQFTNDAYLRECVRTSLIQWQLSLGNDGAPAHRRSGRDPLHAGIAGTIVQLLSHTRGFQTRMLLDDVARHLRWLSRRPFTPAWLEASAIGALVDGTVLVRDPSLLSTARTRLRALLDRQNEEGWFQDGRGVDIGRLANTVDALARVYQAQGWEELIEPLERTLRFLANFLLPNGGFGGCPGGQDGNYLSPEGVELLAPTFPDAIPLALAARRQLAQSQTDPSAAWDDGLCALLGSQVAMAASHTSSKLPQTCRAPNDTFGRRWFPGAGLAIFSTPAYYAVVGAKHGGTLHVTWRKPATAIVDAGIAAVFESGLRMPCSFDPRARHCVADSSVTVGGRLLAAPVHWDRPRRWFRRWVRWIAARVSRRASAKQKQARGLPGRLYRRLAGDRYRREITFGPDWIQVRDAVVCQRPAQAIICQTGGGDRFTVPINTAPQHARPPIYVEGGSRVEITRVYRDGLLCQR